MIAACDYASASVAEFHPGRALLGMSANARRPVRFHGRVTRNIPLLRFTLRALGEAIWSDDTWMSRGAFGSWMLDPVITIHPDRVLIEAFSQDQSASVMALFNPGLFATEGEVVHGTTNVDFSAWFWAALNELRSSRETWLRVGAQGFEGTAKWAGGRFEQRVDLPDHWVRGFLQVNGAMAMPGTRLTVKAGDLLAAIRFLGCTTAKVSPSASRYEFTPGEDVRIVLEPWEHVVRLRGAEHNFSEQRAIRTWGRGRLKLIEPLLPFATSVDIYLKGRGLPSFYAVKLPDMTFVLGLSGWTAQNRADTDSFDLLTDTTAASSDLIEQVHQHLAGNYHASLTELANALNQNPETLGRACQRLCRQGRAVFDAESRGFRHRELFDEPVDEAKLFPPNERLERARALLARNAVPFARCEPQETRKIRQLETPDGPVTREVMDREWRVTGNVEMEKTEIIVGDSGRIVFATCSCGFFQENLLGKGPCEHMIALLRASAEGRKDLPTSTPASDGSAPPPETGAGNTDATEGEEDFD